MTSASRTRRAALLVALAVPSALVLAAGPAQAADAATVSVLHAIPTGSGADVVDVYAGDALLIDNFTPGTLKTLEVPAGTYDLGVYADGETPAADTPVLEAKGVAVPAGANATVTANLTAAGAPALNVFINDTSKTAAGQARVTVRHIAAAPAVDVRVNGNVAFSDLTNPNEVKTDLAAASYQADVVLAGTDTVAIGPATLDLAEGTNTIVYAWGSAEAGNLALATQVISGLHSTPAAVDAGDGSSQSGLPGWVLGVAVLAAVGAAGAGVRLATTRA
ncbi:MAG: DUF4397 domain-containing protein [Actinobacteria bacterium]|uniref:Unannotated protein n=1 Tax=freshwater metagenome TaxID=449393 RepID=A0A6J7SFJ3_9ZZZZ|nr:DUF4397 domain-containing protein [Actinomycetota bacterium]